MTGGTTKKPQNTLADEAKKLAAASASTAKAPDAIRIPGVTPPPVPGSVDWANLEFGDPNAAPPVLSTPGMHAAVTAAKVPEEVDKYQQNVEAARLPKPVTPIVPQPAITRPSEALATKTAADSATELAAAPPNKVAEVIEKLKQEEKKGGPNLFDILEAAAAGFQGNTPLYVQKRMQKAAEEADKEKMAQAAMLQGQETEKRLEADRVQRDIERKQDYALRMAEINAANKRAELASGKLGSLTMPKTGPLDLAELGVGK